jgi:hypothetical protein
MNYYDDADANKVRSWATLLNVGHYFLSTRRYRTSYGSALKFDLPAQVAGRTVTKATLSLYTQQLRNDITEVNPNGPTASMNIQLRASAFVDNWDPSSLSWNVWASLGVQSAGEGLAYAPNQMGPVNFDVTVIVRNWASGTWPNRGIKLAADLYPDPGVDSWGATQFYSPSRYDRQDHRPQLIIDYQ